jgi:phosphotransferase system enzyme I (PtsI)
MKGLGASSGIAIGRVHKIEKKELEATNNFIKDSEINLEIEKLDNAINNSLDEVNKLKDDSENLTENEIDILEAHIELISDVILHDNIVAKIEKEKKCSVDALIEVIESTKQVFLNMGDEYFRERASDIEDIGNRILDNLTLNTKHKSEIKDEVIICASDLTPSETISMDVNKVRALVTEKGGKTSHTAIIAKIRSIPAVVGVGSLTALENGQVIIVDGETGEIIIEPDEETLDLYKEKRRTHIDKIKKLKATKKLEAKTKDGQCVKLYGNISDPLEVEITSDYGGEGIGLFRTEFLFMDRKSFPSEEEQFKVYKEVAVKSKGKPVIIRTLDIGGDKELCYFDMPKEMNPFLGYRAIRICLDRKDIFLDQLKAILRASVFGNLKIMFPMISGLNELKEAKNILEQAKEELNYKKISYNNNIETGIMIEIPSAALISDILAKEVDFFSIGTNDLCQYTLAVDRMNEKIAKLYSYYNPGILRLISQVINNAHNCGIHVGMCGEMASDNLATLLLLGMGLDEFSMSASQIPVIKNIIRNTSVLEAKKIYNDVMQINDTEEVIDYLKEVRK